MPSKLVNRLLDLNFLRKTLGYRAFLASYHKNIRLKISDKPRSGKVMVLSPHPDDEVFGCGGTIIKHVQNGDPVKIVIFSDNKKNFIVRNKEAKEAARILGVGGLTFLHFKDGSIYPGEKETNKLLKIILDFGPEIIYVPYLLDPHPDHEAVAIILKKALKKYNFGGEIWSYEIWTPVIANRIINIESEFEQKVRAIKSHRSQLEDRGYLAAISGLNSYRAGMFKTGKKAEAFFAVGSKLYQTLFKKNI